MKRVVLVSFCFAAFVSGLAAQQSAPASGRATPAAPGRATPPASAASAARRGPAPPAKPLDIYVLDVEGGKSTIWMTPSGQVVLIDTGNPGARDLDRITGALSTLGITKIDYLITTHYHVDHIGGMLELAKRVPIAEFIDHGPTIEPREQVANFQAQYAELNSKVKHVVAQPGDKLPIPGLDWRIVTSAAKVIKTPLPGGGKPNAECATYTQKDPSYNGGLENGQSVGSVVSYGQFRAIDLGDLLWNVEGDLMCPNNPIGTVDVYFASHHGLDYSGSAALVHALHPRVSVMQNGPRKGSAPSTIQIIRSSPGLEDLWESHWGDEAGIENNSAGTFIANLDDNATIAAVLTAPPRAGGAGGFGRGGAPGAPGGPGGAPGAAPTTASGAAAMPGGLAPGGFPNTAPPPPPPAQNAAPGAGAGRAGAPQAGAPGAAAPGAGGPAGPGGPGGPGGGRGAGGGANQLQNPAHTPAYWIKVSAMPDGTFTVTNQRNGFSKTYTRR